jgi:hypothetical protein
LVQRQAILLKSESTNIPDTCHTDGDGIELEIPLMETEQPEAIEQDETLLQEKEMKSALSEMMIPRAVYRNAISGYIIRITPNTSSYSKGL